MRLVFPFVLGVGALVFGCQPSSDADTKDLAALQGAWTRTWTDSEGGVIQENWHFQGNVLTISNREWRVFLNASASPKQMDIENITGRDGGLKLLRKLIYKIDGDKFTVYWFNYPDAPRPEFFFQLAPPHPINAAQAESPHVPFVRITPVVYSQ